MAITAVGTQLGRRKPAANENEVSIPPSGFVFDLPERLTMRRVLNRFGKQGCATCLSGSAFRTQSCCSLRRPKWKTYERSRRDGWRPSHIHEPARDALWPDSRYPSACGKVPAGRV